MNRDILTTSDASESRWITHETVGAINGALGFVLMAFTPQKWPEIGKGLLNVAGAIVVFFAESSRAFLDVSVGISSPSNGYSTIEESARRNLGPLPAYLYPSNWQKTPRLAYRQLANDVAAVAVGFAVSGVAGQVRGAGVAARTTSGACVENAVVAARGAFEASANGVRRACASAVSAVDEAMSVFVERGQL